MKIIIANFKAELTEKELDVWLSNFTSFNHQNSTESLLIVCPPFLYLSKFRDYLESHLNAFALGAQDVSQYDLGTHTGEITAQMLKDFVDYVIIGHSETRRIKKETTASLQTKINQALSENLKVILCTEQPEKYTGDFFALAYEPTSAIGNGQAASPTESWATMQNLQAKMKAANYLYGGSVNGENIPNFLAVGFNGALVGKKSLDPQALLSILKAGQTV